MIRRVVCVCAVAAMGVAWAPARAEAHLVTCSCTIPWAQAFIASPAAQRTFRRSFAATAIPESAAMISLQRRRIRTRVYNWSTAGDFDPDGFCKRHKRICKAAVVCVISGFSAAGATLGNGGTEAQAVISFGSACGASSATVMLYG